MDNSLISVRYANALFLLSEEKDIVDEVYNSMLIINNQCKNTPAFNELLDSPIIYPEQKKETLKSIFEKYVSEIILNFLGVIVDNKREPLLESISRNYIDYYKKRKGIKIATLYTAHKLEDTYISSINELLEKEFSAKIELSLVVQEHLIGGFILMVDGKMLDVSIFNKLKELKNKLLS